MSKSSPSLQWMRRHLKTPLTTLMLSTFSIWSVQLQGADLNWVGGPGNWDTTSLQWSGTAWNNANLDTGVFSGPSGTVALMEAISAGGLRFTSSGYTLSGNTLTLAPAIGINSPVIQVGTRGTFGDRATIASLLAGTKGFTKSGNGTLVLTNSGNTFSGDISIEAGNLVVTNPGQLGTGTTAISVTGIANTGNPGFSGGSLVLAGPGTGPGITLNREVSVAGRGPGAANASGGLISVGNNTLAGGLTISSGATETRVLATHGITNVTGGVYLGGGNGNIFYGNGNWIISGQVTGLDTAGDRFIKTGNIIATTLWLQNNSNNYAQTLRIDSGTVRVGDNGALGINPTSQSVDINNGTLEVRTDTPSSFLTRNVFVRDNTTGGIFVGRGINSSSLLINQTVTFGDLRMFHTNTNLNISGRNGYGISFTGVNNLIGAGGSNGASINNNSNGMLLLDGNLWNQNDGTIRTLSIGGNGDTTVTGSILAPSAIAHNFTKNGTGTLVIGGNASSYKGITTVSGGTLSINDVGAVAQTSQINLGNATTAPAALTYTGPTATLNRNILLNTTTAPIYINSNGTGALTLTGTILNTVNGAHTLVLGGSGTADNTVNSVIPINTTPASVTSLQKIGLGTWVLNPIANNTFTGSTTISGGTLKLQEASGNFDILPDAAAVIFNVDVFNQAAGGTLAYNGAAGLASTETVGALTLTAGAGTLQINPGAGGTAALTFASLAAPSVGTGLNIVPGTGSVSISGLTTTSATTLPGNGHIYINGADFARSNSGVLVTPVYGVDDGFILTGSELAPTSHNLVTTETNTAAVTISSLKILGSQNVNQSGLLTINVGGNTSGGILQTGGSSFINGTGVTTAGSGDLVVRVDASGDTLNLVAPITSTTTGGLTKNGLGTLVLSGANNQSGTVTVNEGTLQMATGGLLGATNIGLTVRQGATFDLNGINVGTIGSGNNSVNALNGAGTITNNGGVAASLRVGNNNTAGYFTGIIQDGSAPLSLVKAGTAALSLTGANTFTGPLVLLGGTLAVTSLADIGVASAIGLGDASNDVSNAASLVFNGGVLQYTGATGTIYQTTQTPSVSTNRLFTLAGNGTIDSSGSYGAPNLTRAANSATLIFNNTAPVAFSGTGVRTLTLQGDSTGDNQINLRLINNPNAGEALSVTKTGGGMWILGNNTNSYSGTTTISAGALRGQDTLSLPTASNLFLNGGVFETTGTFNRSLGTGAGQFRFVANGNGGFSAGELPLVVDWSGLGTPNWGSTTNFIRAGVLILNSSTSLADVDVRGNFELGAGTAKPLSLTTTAGSATVNLTGGTTTDGLTIGQIITGNANIPAGAYITSIVSSTQFTISTGTGVLAATGVASNSAGNGWREVQVNDNGTTNLDFATISGVLSGTGGLSKIGGGTLILGDANTYSGNTAIRQESVFATSIGAAGATSSSFGTNVGGGIIELGNPANSTTANLMYVGPGETTTRQINIVGTTGTRRIDSSGSGALILTNLVNTTAGSVNTVGGNKTLELQGSNTDANKVTSILADNGGSLRLLKGGGGVWILDANNTYTGGTRVDGGLLGIASNASLGTAGPTGLTSQAVANVTTVNLASGNTSGLVVGMNVNGPGISYGDTIATIPNGSSFTLSSARTMPAGSELVFGGLLISNAGIFSSNAGGLTLSQPVILNNNTSSTFAGTAPITINANIYKATGANDVPGLSNNLENGSLLTINGDFVNFDQTAGTRTVNIRGYGSTVWNGVIRNSATASVLTAWNIALAPDATFTMAGGTPNTYSGTTTLSNGILALNKVGALGTGTFAFNGGTLTTGFSGGLVGANKITNAIQINASPPRVTGTNSIEFGGSVALNASRNLQNELTGPTELIISGGITNSAASTFTLYGSGNTLINSAYNAGTGVSGLQMSGTGTLTLTGTNLATGALTASRGNIILSGTSGGTWNAGIVTLNAGGTLTLDNSGGENAAGRLFDTAASLFTANGGTLNFIGDANGTSETTGILTVNNVQSWINMSGAGPNTLTFASVNFANSGSSLDLTGTPNLGSTNKLIFTTAPTLIPATTGIAPRIFVGGDFATYGANGVVPFTAYNNGNNLNTAAVTDTLNVTTSISTTANRTLNALKINGAGLTLGGATLNRLTLTSGGLLNTGGNNTLSIPEVAFGTGTGIIQVNAGTILEVNSSLTGTGNWAKALDGTLQLNTPSFISGTQNLLNGTLKLNAGLNTLFPNQLLQMNIGATLDLNGNTQYFAQLSGPGGLPGTGGSIISSTGTGTLVTNMNGGSTSFSGQIMGNINFARTGGNTLTLEMPQTYTGPTLLMGGTTTLRDDATILNTSAVDINYATLFLANNDNIQTSINNRLSDTAPITLRSGNLTYTGRLSTAATETVGTITLAQGANTLSSNTGGGTITSADLTVAGLVRNPGTTLNFTGSQLGQQGNNARIMFTNPLTTVGSGALGAWAIVNSTDYAAYNTGRGVGIVGQGGFTGYDATFGNGNLTEIPATYLVNTTLPGNTSTGLLKIAGNASNNIFFTGGSDVLNLEFGGLLRSNNAFDTSIGTLATRGILTAGGTETSGVRDLVIFNNATGNPSYTGGTINPNTTVVTVGTTLGLRPGMVITNANFPAGTTIVSIDAINQITVSQPSTNVAQQTSQTLTVGSIPLGATTVNSQVVTMSSTVGLASGMTISGTNIPAGTYIVSVDSPTQVTVSRPATATGATITFTAGISNLIVNSVIADNGFGNSVSLVKSGAGIMNLSANNTYTGGTVVSQGTINLIGNGVVIPAGGVTLTGAAMVMNTNAGQIAPSNAVTLNGSSTLTLFGNNTLDSLSFNNNGGASNPTVTTNGILTLSNATPITVTSSNPLTVPTIAGFLDIGTGAKTINTPEIQVFGNTVTRISPTLNISAAILSPGVTLNKTGNGVLQVSGQSIFTGGLNLNAGGILISGNSTPTYGGTGITSGPLGSGTLTAAAGTTILVDGSRSIGNDVTFGGTPLFDSTANTAWTLNLNGDINGLANGTANVQINNPLLTVALLGNIPNIGSITSFNKTGLGTLIFNATGYTGDFNAAALGNQAAVSLLHDGNVPNIGNSTVESIPLGNVVFNPGIVGTITVGRAGANGPFVNAANKILVPASVSNVGNGLSVVNNNGYGLAVTAGATMTGTPVYTVTNATASNVTQGLYLNGVMSGSGFVKTGAGTMVLGNAGNNFTGNVNINQGVVSVDSDSHLGNAANLVLLNPQAGTATLRFTNDVTTSRIIQLSNTTNLRAIEVIAGKTVELNSSFDLNAGAGAAAGLIKADRGTLVLNTANTGWSGPLTIAGGAVKTNLATTLGSGTISIINMGSALQLQGGITVPNPITIDTTVTAGTTMSQTFTGINSGGAIQALTGANVISNNITVVAAPTSDNVGRNFGFGADSGASLALNGNISFNHASGGANRNVIVYMGGAGNISFGGTLDNTNASIGNSFVFKTGSGSLTLTNANAMPDSEVRIYRGNLVLSGAGSFGASALQAQVYQNGTLTLDNTVTNTANRFGSNRVVQLLGGTVNALPNASGSSHVSTGLLQINSGASTINMGAGGNQTITFASLTQSGGATLNLTGTFGTATNRLTFTTAPGLSPATTGLLARVLTNNNEFATYGANGVTTFTGYAAVSNILSVGATQTFRATPATANSLTGNQTLNALTLNTGVGSLNVGGLAGLNPTTLTITSGGILVNGTGTNATLSVPVVALAGAEGIVHVGSGMTLDVSSGISGTGGLTKSLNGVLNFNQQQYYSGTTTVNAGTLNLNPGTTNTLLFNNGLTVNTGATVDLKNGVQFIGSLSSAGGGGNTDLSGGTVTNSGAEATFVTNSNSNFNGQITGSIYLNKTGTNSLNLQEANTYTGATLINGGTLSVSDKGTLANTTAITVSRGSLTLSNGNLYSLTNRINDAAPITLMGGNITLNGRGQSDVSEVLGNLTLVDGNNSIFTNLAGGAINTNRLDFGTFNRAPTSTATLRFNALGAQGLIGSANRIFFSGGVPLTNNLIGPWAVVDREYATYDATYGVSALGQAGMATYDGSGLNTSPLPTDNVRFSTTGTTVLANDTTLGTLNFASQNAATVVNLNGKTLTVRGGGILFGQQTDNVDFSITNGTLTSGVLNSPSDLYLVQANYGGTNRTVTIGATIADNGAGALRLIKASGQNDGVMFLTGTNTYTGGTVVNSGTLTVGATGTLGLGGITVNQGTFTQQAGGIIPSQVLTMNGGSVATLAGANSLSGLNFVSNGGSGPVLNPTGTLTLTGGITSTPTAAGVISTVSNGIIDLNSNASFSVNVAATMVNGKDVAPWQSGLTINSVIQNGGIVKSGAGVLQLGGQSTFAGGVNVTAGGLIIGASSTPSGIGDSIITGPLGTGAVTMAAGTTLLGSTAVTVSNNFTFLGDTVFNGVNNITLNGITTLPSVWNAVVTAPQTTVTIADASPSVFTDIINKSGLGILVVGNYAGTIQAAGGLVFTGDGNGLGTLESLPLGGNLTLTGDTAITVNRSGSAPNARNKTLQRSTLTIPGNILSVSNQNGYGLEFTGGTTMTGPAHFAVGVATGSNVVQGLILSGPVDDGASTFGLIKSGPGTLVLNGVNTFGGVGQTIDILNGVLSVNSDAALGDAGNSVTLNVDLPSGVGFRSTGTFSTARTFNLNQTNNVLEVTSGNVFTVTTPFSFSSASNLLHKYDNGVMEIAADNSGWTGPALLAANLRGLAGATGGLNIHAGAVRLSHNNAAGTGAIVVAPNAAALGAALQLANNVTINNPLTTQGIGNQLIGGLNFGGQLQSVSGNNTYAGPITMPWDTAIGADAGATLNITGGITNTLANHQLWFTGAGDINLSGTALAANTTATGFFAIQKFGSGTLTIGNANTVGISDATGFRINAGTVLFNGTGTWTGAFTSTSTNYFLSPRSTLTVDNTANNISNRLGTSRLINFTGGNFNLIGNSAATTTESFGSPTFNRGYSVITVTAGAGGGANLVFSGQANNPGTAQNSGTVPSGASVLFRGSNLGAAAANGVATIASTGGTGFTFVGQTGAAGLANKGILPWALVDASATGSGTSFATASTATSILRPLAANEYNAANAVVANNNALLTSGTTNVAANVAPNSITIEGNAGISMGNGVLLSISSGGVLVRSGSTSTISGGVINQINTSSPLNFWTVGDLTISSTINGGNGQANGNIGFVKAGAGTLTLAPATALVSGLSGLGINTMGGQLVLNNGTLKLGAGIKNALQTNNFVAINNATLDLNGNSQQILTLFGDSAVANAGGIITSSTGTGSLFVNQDNAGRNWAGSIQGNVNFARAGQNTLTLYSSHNYTGTTLINGGTTTLRDEAAFTGTTAVTIAHATLLLDNNASTINLTNRLNDAAAITLQGGTLTIQGRAQTASSEVLGAISADLGFNVINPLVGGTGINSMDVSLASLSRPAGSSATLIVQGTNLGTIGSNSRVTVGSLNGVATTPVTYSANGSGLTNNIVGGWAINGNDFLTYIPGLGLAALNQVGAAQYDFNNSFTGAGPTDNVRLTATTNVPNGGANINALSMSGSNIPLNFVTATDTLNITSGGLIGPNNNQNIGATLDSGRLTAGGLTPGAISDLYLFNRTNTLQVNSRIIDNVNGSGSSVRVVLTPSGGAITYVNPNASYTGGTVVNGGTLNLSNTAASPVVPLASNPANGLIINGATVQMNGFAGQVASGNIVTLNGGGTINYFGNNTQAGFVLNNIGSAATPVVQSFQTTATAGSGANGVLTIGSNGVVATSSNVGVTSTLVGRFDFGSSPNTITVDTINANGVNDIAPLQAGLAIQGIVGSSGGITKLGPGVLQLNAQQIFTGGLTVSQGGLRNGVTNAGSRFAQLTLNAGTRYDLGNATTTWGSLSGSGEIFSYVGTPTLNVGFDNTNSTFSGQFSRFNAAVPNSVLINKVGTGVLTLDSAQNATTGSSGNITVSGGGITYSGAGKAFVSVPTATAPSSAVTFTVNSTGTLTLDNTLSNLNNRLSLNNAAGQLTIQGGTFAILGNSAAATTELINNTTFQNGGGTMTLLPDAAQQLNVTTTLGNANATGTGLIRGVSTTAANGAATLTATITVQGGQGTGANGTTTMAIRPDFVVDSSASGIGTGFLVRDSVATNRVRALTTAELNQTPSTWATAQNAGVLGTAALIRNNTNANSLTFDGTASLASGLDAAFGNYGPGGTLLTQSLNVAGLLALDASTVTTSVGSLAGNAGNTIKLHTLGSSVMNVDSYFAIGSTGGFNKAGDGTLNLNRATYFTGGFVINGGTVNLPAGVDKSIVVAPTAGAPALNALQVNAGTLNLNGSTQVFGSISTNNALPGTGGTITNSSGTASSLTATGGGTFGGQITGNLSLTRTGNNTLLLTSANSYTGSTTVRGGVLQLRDSGSISSTAGLALNYGILNWDNFGLNTQADLNPTRLAPSNPVSLLGGTLQVVGGGSIDTVVNLNTVTVAGGSSTINVLPFISEGSTVRLNIGNLVRDPGNRSGVNFNGFTTNNSSGTSSLGGQGLSINGQVILNQINGTAFSASNLVDGLIGGWAVADGNTFATYVNGFGVSVMGQTTQGIVAPVFTGSDISAATVATGNYSDTSARTLTGAKVANSWRFAPGATQAITFSTGATAALDVGIITNAAFSTTLTATDATNTIQGTGAELYFYVNQNVLQINTAIIGSAALVSNGGATLRLSPAFASNTYTGGTFIQRGTLNLQAATGLIAIPGDLSIDNAAVTMSTTPNQIAPSSNITFRGAGNITFANYATATTQTLASLNFINEGGNTNPNLSYGTPTALSTIVLTSSTPISATNNSNSTIPTIRAETAGLPFSALQFSSSDPVIQVNAGLAETGLAISVPITQHANMLTLTKTGAGALALSGASTFTTGFTLSQGSLIFGASSTGTVPTITSGPVGTGTLTIAGGTTILTDNTARTIGNATTVTGDFTFGGVLAGHNLTLSGAMNLGAAGRSIAVPSPAVTATLSGPITSTATGIALTKTGNGTLLLSNATSNLGGAGIAVTGGILRNGINNAIPATSPISVSAGAGYDLNNFDQTLAGISGAGFITNSGNSTKTLTAGDASNTTFSGVLTDNDTVNTSSRLALVKTGSGTLSLTHVANDYTGATTINGGVLEVTKLANGGTVSSIGNSANTAANLVINGADSTLSYVGSGDSTDRSFTIGAAGGAIHSSGTGAVSFTSTAAPTLAGTNTARTFTLGGTNTGANTFAAPLGNNGTGATSLVKAGAGTWVLTAANGYTGGTTVNGGILQIGTNTSLTATTGAGPVSVAAGGTLAGTGTIAGNTTIAAGAVLSPGDSTAVLAVDRNGNLSITGTLGTALGGTADGQIRMNISMPTLNSSGFADANTLAPTSAFDYYTNVLSPAEKDLWNAAQAAGAHNYDFISVTGALTLTNGAAGSPTVAVTADGYTNYAFGDIFNLFDWNTLTTRDSGGVGTFDPGSMDNLLLPTLGAGLTWDTSLFTTAGIIVVVPEPSRALLMLLAFMVIGLRRRRSM
jgi:autotransporter-associated beta strand protein